MAKMNACGGCGKADLVLNKCGRCQVALYCGVRCQKEHWPKHKATCEPPPNTFSIKVHAVGLAHIRNTVTLYVPTDAPLCHVMDMVKNHPAMRRCSLHTLEALDKSKIGRRDFRTGLIHTDFPDARPAFTLDKEDPSRPALACGLYEGAELMLHNGEMD